MATLPPVTLGVIILLSFLILVALRAPLQQKFILQAAEISQPKREFVLDLALCLAAGIVANAYNGIAFGFPISSMMSLMIGCAVAGFFIGLDSALQRERQLIRLAVSRDHILRPPQKLYSMTRKFSFVALTTTLIVSVVMAMVFARDIDWLSKIGQDAAAIYSAQLSVTYEVFFIMAFLTGLVVNLIISYSRNLKLLFDSETDVLERVTNGDLSRKVPVATNDEFGQIAGYTNNMIDGLRHRIRLISALKLAEEVQQTLLPHDDPHVAGLDVSGTSIYCDETGGDYYDYFHLPQGRLGIVVADASDHGVGAAMHMTTVRAFLHFAVRHYQGPARLLNDVNAYATRDSAETGRFMSMFFLEIHPTERTLRWVRAGHEPALLFDPGASAFRELNGKGMALGVDENYRYDEYSQAGWNPNDIILIGTDGIHETRNESGRMFGQDRLRSIIRQHAAESAESIQTAVIKALNDFRGGAPYEDDITLVVVKLGASPSQR